MVLSQTLGGVMANQNAHDWRKTNMRLPQPAIRQRRRERILHVAAALIGVAITLLMFFLLTDGLALIRAALGVNPGF